MTPDERQQLHEQAAQLAYLAIRYADLSPLLSCKEWDKLADETGKEVVELILQRAYAVKDAKEGEDAEIDAWLAKGTVCES